MQNSKYFKIVTQLGTFKMLWLTSKLRVRERERERGCELQIAHNDRFGPEAIQPNKLQKIKRSLNLFSGRSQIEKLHYTKIRTLTRWLDYFQ